MKDLFGRNLSYFRISVTDRCNLRCRYCMPEEGLYTMEHDEILRYDEIVRLARIMVQNGVWRFRLTGGEPLVRKNLPQLATDLKAIDGAEYLGLTTNGLLLEEMAADLYGAGVDGLNISLDTTERTRFEALTRRDGLDKVLSGLHTALRLPFKHIKINCVLSESSTEEDWMGVLTLAKEYPVDVRYIELMPMTGVSMLEPASIETVKCAIEAKYGALCALSQDAGAGPAIYWKANGFRGRIGFIPAMSHQFCETCNRLRLTADGKLKLCLFYEDGMDIKQLLRNGSSDADIEHAIRNAIMQKPKKHHGVVMQSEREQNTDRPCGMYRIGG